MLPAHKVAAVVGVLFLLFHFSIASAIVVRQSGIRFLIVGDSISHGTEGDYTWRYRLWQWLRANNVNFDFVGPWTGTFDPAEPLPPQPPLLQGEPEPAQVDHVTGGYALDIDPAFDRNHFTHSGRQVAQVKDRIAAIVSQYSPDYVLIELGFNDLGWLVSGAEGLLTNMKTLIDNARGAKSNIKFAIANVPYRTRIGAREDLIVKTDVYNDLLANAIPQWNTANSPIELVRFRENYRCMSLLFSERNATVANISTR